MFPIPSSLSLWLVGGATVIGIIGVQQIRVNHYRADAAEAHEAIAAGKAAAELEKTMIEGQWRSRYELLEASEAKAKEDLAHAVDAADDERRGLLNDIDKYRKARAPKCASPGQDQPGGDPIGVLANLLSRADEMAGVYAKVADARKLTAQACEARLAELSR